VTNSKSIIDKKLKVRHGLQTSVSVGIDIEIKRDLIGEVRRVFLRIKFSGKRFSLGRNELQLC
jgi:hypothetical protein